MAIYHLATYRSSEGQRAGAVVGDLLYDVSELTGVAGYTTTAAVLEDWSAAHDCIEAAALAPTCAGSPLPDQQLLAPVSRPGAVYCVGSNYREHTEEMRVAGNRARQPDPRSLGLQPFFFLKSSHAVTGPDVTVAVTAYSAQPDWEIELVVVVGRTARDLSVEEALGCVAGYTVGNDMSARDHKARDTVPTESLFRADWLRHKSFDNSAPMGPWMTPAAYLSDPADLRLRLWVNDELKQDSNSRNMIFSAAEQISYLSSGITLHPGDLIMTGTPAGVGAGRGQYLAAGDTVTMDIAEIGAMSFRVA